MSKNARFFLIIIAPIMAGFLAILGVATLPSNPIGWFLLIVGAGYILGLLIAFVIRRQHFWESPVNGTTTHEERGDLSFWAITSGMISVFYLSPLEFIYLSSIIPRTRWISYSGAGLVILGISLFIWARRTLHKSYSGHIEVKIGQALVQSGPYHLVRHPAYTGYLLMSLGISLGYASLAGLISVFALLFPGLIYRVNVEEKLLEGHFGDVYRQYERKTKRLIPGIW